MLQQHNSMPIHLSNLANLSTLVMLTSIFAGNTPQQTSTNVEFVSG